MSGKASASSKADSIEAGPTSSSTWLTIVSARASGSKSDAAVKPEVVIGVMTRICMRAPRLQGKG